MIQLIVMVFFLFSMAMGYVICIFTYMISDIHSIHIYIYAYLIAYLYHNIYTYMILIYAMIRCFPLQMQI